MVNSPILDKSI